MPNRKPPEAAEPTVRADEVPPPLADVAELAGTRAAEAHPLAERAPPTQAQLDLAHVARDALLAERDELRADLVRVRSDLGTARLQLERAQLEAQRAARRPAAVAQPAPAPLEVQVALNARDARAVREMAEEDYRTPAQQVGWIVAQWLKLHRSTMQAPVPAHEPGRNGTAEPSAALLGASAAERGAASPIPVYHVGDGSAGSGCGKVGLFFARPLGEGSTIGPGDVLLLDGTPLTAGGLVCGACGGPFTMHPRNWRAGTEE
jgi:hypothetical protein